MSTRRQIFVLAILLFSVHAFAQPATTPSQTRPTTAAIMQATITGVEGLVQVRMSEDQPWKPAKVGMTLTEGAEFRTGPRSAVRFVIPPDQTITLDRLGTVKLLEAIKTKDQIKTDLGMKYGRVRYDIEAAGIAHDATIRSPGNTLAVRGTIVSLYNQAPFTPVATSLTGRAVLRKSNGDSQAFGNKSPTQIQTDANSAAQTALAATYVDPVSSQSHSPSEQESISAVPLVAGFVLSPANPTGGSPRPITPPPITPPATDTLPGPLVFQLVWVGSQPNGPTPDFDLFVTSPHGEQLCPKDCSAVVSSGGHSPTDDKGSAGGGASQESAVWADTFPKGTFQFGAKYVSGPSGEFQLVVLKNGQLVGDPETGTLDSSNLTSSFSIDLENATTSSNKAAAHSASRNGRGSRR